METYSRLKYAAT